MLMCVLKNSSAGSSRRELNTCQLFFIDSGPSTVPQSNLIARLESDADEGQGTTGVVAAWVDSDDERITVSLASDSRLRKLRNAESEDLVNGREYTTRLRRHFERLYPVPDWANPSAEVKQCHKKRRRSSIASDSSGEDPSADDMSIDFEDLSAQPLAKLIQNTNPLVKRPSPGRKKLRSEVIDIQRTKDVGLAQPVRTLL